MKANPADTEYKYGFKVPEKYVFKSKRGLSEDVVREISAIKSEPDWMLEFRLQSLVTFNSKKMPEWGGDLSDIDFQKYFYYVKSSNSVSRKWSEVPKEVKTTFDRLGVPEAERKYLAGVGAQYESEMIYHNLKKEWADKGVVFKGIDQALIDHPDIFKEYFSKAVPASDNKFSALNSAVWSGGSFVYVPKNVHVEIPLQAYFRINSANMGQFERTLIIVDEGASVHYVEGCTAPTYSTNSLHAAVVEIFVKKGARCRYTTIQNWSHNVYNLVTKRAFVEEEGVMEWVDGNLGSKLTMKYPSVFLMGRKARGEVLSIALAGKGQHQDAGGKIIHLAPDTSGRIISKSISKDGGRTSYRGQIKIPKGRTGCKSFVQCDALIIGSSSRSDTYPYMDIQEKDSSVEHEATVSKIGEEQLFYLMSRGLSELQSKSLIVNGFIEPIAKELPMEFAMELNNLIQMEMEGSVG